MTSMRGAAQHSTYHADLTPEEREDLVSNADLQNWEEKDDDEWDGDAIAVAAPKQPAYPPPGARLGSPSRPPSSRARSGGRSRSRSQIVGGSRAASSSGGHGSHHQPSSRARSISRSKIAGVSRAASSNGKREIVGGPGAASSNGGLPKHRGSRHKSPIGLKKERGKRHRSPIGQKKERSKRAPLALEDAGGTRTASGSDAHGGVFVSSVVLRELIDQCSRLEYAARSAQRLSEGFANACAAEARSIAEVRDGLARIARYRE